MNAGRGWKSGGLILALACATANADVGAWVQYTGLDRVHLRIEIPYTSYSSAVEIGPNVTNILWQGYGPVTLNVFRVNMAPGNYEYLLNYEYHKGSCTIPAAFEGTPLQDELYEGVEWAVPITGAHKRLIVPSGRSIGLQGVTLHPNYTLAVGGEGAFTVADSHLGGLIVTGSGTFAFSKTAFRGSVHVVNAGVGSSGATFIENTFYGGVLASNTTALFENNVFCSPIQVHTSGERPTIQNNSFVDRRAIIGVLDEWSHPAVQIERNYFGERQGPTYRGDPEYEVQRHAGMIFQRLLMRGGATVEEYYRIPHPLFDLPPEYSAVTIRSSLGRGPERTDKNVFPNIWCAGVVAYQQSIGTIDQTFSESKLRQGRPWIISADVRGWDSALNGVAVYALVDGVRYDADPVPVRRDPGTAEGGYGGVRNGRSLFNVRLPAMNRTQANVRVYLDTTGVRGYPGSGGVTLIKEGAVNLLPGFARPLRIMVAPWEIRCPGYSTATPSAAGVVAELRRRMPTMLPLNPSEFNLQVVPPNRYYAGYGALLEVLWAHPLLMRLAFDAKLFLDEYNNLMPNDQRIDRLIAVVPHGVVQTDTNMAGQGLVFRRIDTRIAIVEQTAPDAVIHELIHTLGYSREQYLDYPPDGISMDDHIGYSPGGDIDGSTIRAWPSWAGGIRYYDVMGRGKFQWILPVTWFSAYNGLRAELGSSGSVGGSTAAKVKSDGAVFPQNSAPVRTILLRGSVLGDTQLVASTLAGIDRSGISTNVWRGEPAYDNNGYNFIAYDQGMNILTTYPFVAEGPWFGTGIGTGDYERVYARADGAPWQRYFDYPTNATRLRITGAAYNPGTYWEAVRNTNLACAILTPPSDSVIAGVTQLLWTITGAGTTTAHLSETAWSTNGTTWNLFGNLWRTNTCSLAAEGLPASTSISIRLRVSDGLNTATAMVHRLRVGNQPPAATIRSPVDGDHGTTSIIWRLRAAAHDLEDGLLTNGVWTSSRDGVLAVGLDATTSLLSTGVHWIVFTAADTGGLVASARVAVTVGVETTLDLRVASDALEVKAPYLDPIGTLDPFFELGRANDVIVHFRNGGIFGESTAAVRLWVQPPSGAEALVASQELIWTAFEETSLRHEFAPTARGLYRIRARIDAMDPPDTNPANNEQTWEVPCGLGHLFVHLDPPAAVAAGAQWRLDGGPWRASDTALSNLASGVHTIEFSYASGFELPRPSVIEIAAGRRASFSRLYQPGGDVRVTITPSLAVQEGAQWRIDGGAWRTNGETASGIATGLAVITYRDLPWWQTPAAQTVTVRAAMLTATNGVYGALPRPPVKPVYSSPSNGESNVNAEMVYFFWSAPTGFDSYRLECGTNANLGMVYDEGQISYVWDLDYDRLYYWRIILSNAVGVTTGDTWSFRTEKPPPMIISPRISTGVVGHVFNYRIEAANATGWGPVSLPPWLTNINGTLRGICPSAGVEYVELYASNAVAYRTTLIVLVIEGGVDLAWQPSASGVTVDLHGVTYGNGQFVAVGDRGTILTSPDGLVWTSRNSTVTNSLRGVVWGSNVCVAVGFEGTVVRSTNGIAWARQTSGIARSLPLLGVGYGFGKFVAVGYEKWILNSANGTTWTERNFTSGSINPLAGVTITNGAMVTAGGIGFGFPTFMRSTNADAWSNVAASGSDGFHDIAAGAGKFVAVGRNGAVHSSTNGLTWIVHPPPTSRDLFGICHGEDQFAAVSWTGSVRTSTSAQDWRSISSGVSEDLYSIAYGAGRFVAVGRFGRIVTAPYLADRDGDAFPDQVEQRIGTNPLDPDSHLAFSGATTNTAAGFVIRWQSVSGRVYAVYRATNLTGTASFTPLAPAVTGLSGFTTWTDTTAISTSPRFYRIHTDP